MSDHADLALEIVEARNARALEVHASRQETGPVYTGYCLECGEDLDNPRRWCDAECRDQWERRQR